MLNEYFDSVYTQENIENLPSFESKYDGPPFSKPYITVDTVRKQLLRLNVNKVNGADGLHSSVLRENDSHDHYICHLLEVTRQQLLALELEDHAVTQPQYTRRQQNRSRQL